MIGRQAHESWSINVTPVDYDKIASRYDERYRTNRFDGIRAELAIFLGIGSSVDVVEIGCGTGHWLNSLESEAGLVAGVDPSWAMLAIARRSAAHAVLVRAGAESLPFDANTFDRAFCINALHHFQNTKAFVKEARRVLRPGGGLLNLGIDPHSGLDQWWVYDYFPNTLVADRARYTSASAIRELFHDAGLVRVSTKIAQHIPASIPFASALEQGLLDRGSTSQLLVIDDSHWEAGFARLHAVAPVLEADLRLYATVGWLD